MLVAPEWQELATKLTNGDGLGWPGDPNLFLEIGVLVQRNRATGQERVGRQLQVWRHNEDGSKTMVGHWRPDEQMKVCFDLAQMRVDAPGHIPVEKKIDDANAAKEKDLSTQAQESMIQTLDHALRLHHDRTQPRNTFYMNGRGAGRA